MKKKNMLAGVSFVAVALLASSAAFGQAITAEEVTAVMESSTVKTAFTNCAASAEHPSVIDFIFIIGADGSAVLSKTEPVLASGLMSCFQGAAGTIKMKQTGKKFEITYPMEFAPYTPTTAGTATGTTGTATAGGGIVVLPPQTTATQPATAAPPAAAAAAPPPAQPQPKGWADPRWEREYRTGTGMVIAGAVLTGLGGAMVVGALIGVLIYVAPCGFANSLFGSNVAHCDVPVIVPVLLFGGLASLITGIIVLAIGSVKKRRAAAMRYSSLFPQLGLHPLIDEGGGVATLAWRF
jgi:hypothetical protein